MSWLTKRSSFHLNELSRLPQLLGAAAAAARSSNAHVSGLYVIPAVQLYPSMGFEAVPQTFDGNRIYFKDNEEKVRTSFEDAMKKEGLGPTLHPKDGQRGPNIPPQHEGQEQKTTTMGNGGVRATLHSGARARKA